ncbi:hypothetical protein ZIOFF_062963 [Zingiber officinale]|uniref:RING-type domain-containing protein n=1 Tax=Zingiber officinale TaxID=94328 RepID=A0A8J5F133_ZINOF|nr:hypothetical protein ZIOFF_062963 [Zingiber officinale]
MGTSILLYLGNLKIHICSSVVPRNTNMMSSWQGDESFKVAEACNMLHEWKDGGRAPLGSCDDSADCDGSLGSGLAGLALLADHLAADRTFPFLLPRGDDLRPDCSVCLCRLADGDRVRRIPCGHVFHRDCLDGWLLQLNLSCPLCRYRLVAPELRAAADRRIGAELVACLSQS